jgi:hypothetical protein
MADGPAMDWRGHCTSEFHTPQNGESPAFADITLYYRENTVAIPDLKPPLTADTIEESLRNAKRAIKHKVQDLEDLRDTAALQVRKAPLATVGVALGTGLLLGLALGWMSTRISAGCPEKTAA